MKKLKENIDIFISNIYPKIKDKKLDNFEKLILIKGFIQILEKMFIKYYGKLSSEDKKIIEDIIKEEKLSPIKN